MLRVQPLRAPLYKRDSFLQLLAKQRIVFWKGFDGLLRSFVLLACVSGMWH